ncbi:hypothetical protein AURDEDRAFT_147753 [Auricularia subglabra TFB-10046 SS5]|nr:hypothetical protein AURDEDRAFT_147753 [Auricularia subglabra TFB-10046 SS5]
MNSDLEEFSVGVHGLLSRQLSQAPGSEEAFDALERDIGQSMANVFRSFRRKKNDEAAINLLPAELLTLILRHVDGNALESLVLGHVCQQWRQVALAEQRLWTRIELRGDSCKPEVLSALLERTGVAAVSLDLCAETNREPPCNPAELGTIVSDHLPRLEHLALTGDSKWIGTLQASLVLPAPVLRSLELCDMDAHTVAIILPDIFARKSLVLERLVLVNVVPIIWNNFLFAHLRELTLEGAQLSPSTFDLATCLSTIPELRKLSVSCRIRPFPPHSGDEIPWPAANLNALELRDQPDDTVVNTVLSHLPLSALASADVSPVQLPTMALLLKSTPMPTTSLSLTAPSSLHKLTVRATAGEQQECTRSGVIYSTDGIPCTLLFRHLETGALTRLAISYELWPYALSLLLPALTQLTIHYNAVPPPAFQLSLFLNPSGSDEHALRVPALKTLALTAPVRSPIKLQSLVYLVTRAVRLEGVLEELALANVYAEEEDSGASGEGGGLKTLLEKVKRLLLVPSLPQRLKT